MVRLEEGDSNTRLAEPRAVSTLSSDMSVTPHPSQAQTHHPTFQCTLTLSFPLRNHRPALSSRTLLGQTIFSQLCLDNPNSELCYVAVVRYLIQIDAWIFSASPWKNLNLMAMIVGCNSILMIKYCARSYREHRNYTRHQCSHLYQNMTIQ